MEEQFKEIEGLLEAAPPPPTSKIKKYVKLVFPHVALVAVVCLYAVIGAWIFYSLESPNEDRLKTIGQRNIETFRTELMGSMHERKRVEILKTNWKKGVDRKLGEYNEQLYKAFKEQYVRYPDVRLFRAEIEESTGGTRTKRHRQNKGRAGKSEKLWTASSALFFAATTMATIGYGNIVPATSSGRIACVVFALFGAPLAIITIGDLGKFLSECTIWLYKRMKRGKGWLRQRIRQMRANGKGEILPFLRKKSRRKKRGLGDSGSEISDLESKSSHSTLDWEDLVMDKTEVPVLMVFAILLLYIAFGGVLFSFLEDWSYMDAFYYSFISLTTIGFGDIVPENHEYIVIMLIYLGVGLAVTTMCIDLVGIQYIQKIHYFGRKFRGTDLLQLLKRKRMIERRLAMGQGEEILQMYIQQIASQLPPEPETVVVADRWEAEKVSVQQTPTPSTPSVHWIEEAMVRGTPLQFDYPLTERVPSPTVLSIRSWRPPSRYSNSSASARSMMYNRIYSRGGSWAESGPSISEHCSLSTEPSVHIRQSYWDEFRSPDPSIDSFKFDFPLPSPDYERIAQHARRSRRVRSCPGSWDVPSPSVSPIGLACMEDWDSYIRMLEDCSRPYVRPVSSSSSEGPAPYDIDLGAFELVDSGVTAEALLSTEDPVIFHKDMPVHSVHHDTVQTEAALENLMSAPESMLSGVVPPTMVDDNYCFVVDGDKIRMGDIMGDDQWWRHTSRPTKYFFSEDLKKFHRVNCITAKGKVISASLASGTMGGLAASQSMSSTPRSSVSGASSSRASQSRAEQMRRKYSMRGRQEKNKVPLVQVYKVIRFYSFWKTCTSFHRIVTMIDKVTNEERGANPDFKKRLFVQYLWRNAKALDKARVQKEFDPRRQRLLRFVTDPVARKKVFNM